MSQKQLRIHHEANQTEKTQCLMLQWETLPIEPHINKPLFAINAVLVGQCTVSVVLLYCSCTYRRDFCETFPKSHSGDVIHQASVCITPALAKLACAMMASFVTLRLQQPSKKKNTRLSAYNNSQTALLERKTP